MELTVEEFESISEKISVFRSRRLRILMAVEALLKTIEKSRGYSRDISIVTFDSKSWRDISAPDTPAIFIMDDVVQIERNVGRNREYTWTIKLFGVMKETSFEDFEEFIADVEQCIEINYNLIGTVSKCEIQQVITDNQLFDNTDTRLFEIDLRCEYTRCHMNPR